VEYKRTNAFAEGRLGAVTDLLLTIAEHEGMGWQLDGAAGVMQQASAAPGPSTATTAGAGRQAAAATRPHSSAPQQTRVVITRQPAVSQQTKQQPPSKIMRK
jgi:hypothetical protein